MQKLKIKTGVNVYSGGLFGAIMFASKGGSSAMVINKQITVFYMKDHWSIRHKNCRQLPFRLLAQIAKEACGLTNFKIRCRTGEKGIYNIF